jgi:hypothetical protein
MTVGAEMSFAIVRNYRQRLPSAIDFFSTSALDSPDKIAWPDAEALVLHTLRHTRRDNCVAREPYRDEYAMSSLSADPEKVLCNPCLSL